MGRNGLSRSAAEAEGQDEDYDPGRQRIFLSTAVVQRKPQRRRRKNQQKIQVILLIINNSTYIQRK